MSAGLAGSCPHGAISGGWASLSCGAAAQARHAGPSSRRKPPEGTVENAGHQYGLHVQCELSRNPHSPLLTSQPGGPLLTLVHLSVRPLGSTERARESDGLSSQPASAPAVSFALSRPVPSPVWCTVILILPGVCRSCLLNPDSTSIRQALCSLRR